VDPVTHLILPLLLLLAAKQDSRIVVPLSLFAIFPDFDSLLGPHRMVLHNLFVIVGIPLAFILIARVKKPSFVYPGMIVMFYLVSHIILDMSGVALLYPFYENAFFFVPHLTFTTAPSLSLNFFVEWGTKPLLQTNTYSMIGDLGFALILMLILLIIIKRKELPGWIEWETRKAKQLVRGFIGLFSRRDTNESP
jgi:LexA-binding, inner membrane-associated putative hydrolase